MSSPEAHVSITICPNFERKFYSVSEHKVAVDVDQMNRELLERDRSLWDALESSKWLPIEQLESF